MRARKSSLGYGPKGRRPVSLSHRQRRIARFVSCLADNEYHTFIASKYEKLRKRQRHKVLALKASSFKPAKNKRIRSSILNKLLGSIVWHQETPKDLQDSIHFHIKDVLQRIGYDAAAALTEILEKYQDRIARFKFDVGSISHTQFKIVPKGDIPRFIRKPHNLPIDHEEEIKRTVETLEKYGIIRRVDLNKEDIHCVSNVFCVRNHDSTTRMVSDYVTLNHHCRTDPYPTPNVQDMLSKFNGKTIFSTFDIVKAFFNVPVAPESQKYLAFVTKYGIFTWCYMPFGPKNAPAVWAKTADYCFAECIDLIKYIDDMVIASQANENGNELTNHIKAIQSFFECLERFNLKIKLSKCSFFQREIKFLGVRINCDGRRVDDAYIRKLLQFQHPTNVQELRSYLGAIEWIARHCYGMKQWIQPLRPLLKGKNSKKTNLKPFHEWTSEHQRAFNRLQNMIKNHTQLLHHPNFTQPFYVFTDSSQRYFSGVLFQKRDNKYVIIDMYSRTWTESQEKKHITTKELMAVIECCRVWRHYLIAQPFIIHSDSRNIMHLFSITNSHRSKNNMHYKWVAELSQYSFEVRHIKGIHNIVADHLSRHIKPEVMRNLSDFNEGSTPFSKYNEHKRLKFRRRTLNVMHSKTFLRNQDNDNISDDEFDRIYFARLTQSTQYRFMCRHAWYQQFDGIAPLWIDLNGQQMHHLLLRQHALCTKQLLRTKYDRNCDPHQCPMSFQFPRRSKRLAEKEKSKQNAQEKGGVKPSKISKNKPSHSKSYGTHAVHSPSPTPSPSPSPSPVLSDEPKWDENNPRRSKRRKDKQ